MLKKIVSIFSVFIMLLVFLYHNNSFYSKMQDSGVVRFSDDIVNEFNVARMIYQKDVFPDDYVDLILSGDDLKHISNSMKLFTGESYIRDQINPWRKAKVIVDGQKERVKYKFHGTDASSMIARRPFLDKLKMKLGLGNVHSVSPVGAGTFSLKIKHKKNSRYYQLMRRYKLINPYDSHEISTTIINTIASKIGLMAPHGRTVILRINGSEIGAYMLVEAHNKEWFERVHQLTNYTIFSSTDDWDRKVRSHESDTDLHIQNKKIRTISKHAPVATGALELLLKSIKRGDIKQIKRMIDVDYMAKYMALLAITNESHPVTGDNLRYVYNHATGRFKLLFRLEGSTRPNNRNIAEFNSSFFSQEDVKGIDIDTFKLFKLLLTDSNFLTKRDEELNKIVQNSSQWKVLTDAIVAENMRVFLASKMSIRPIEYKIDKFKENFENNIEKARKYLNYNKIFITKYTDINGKKSLRFINDFVHPVTLSKTLKLDNENKLKSENTNIFIKPSQLDINQKIIYKEQITDIGISDPAQLSFVNNITGKKILSRHVYFNEALEYPVFSKEKSFQTLNDNDINYNVNYKDKLITIQSGQYEINVNIITPYGFDLVIQKNTKLLLNKGVSFLVRGGLDINGTMDQPVIIDRKDKNTPFGVFSVAGEEKESVKVSINHLKFSGGSEALVNGIQFTGQMSIINAKVSIKNSIFQGSVSDDGINIKYSKVNISNSKFINNFADQIDLDYCQATIINNIFSSKKSIKLKDLVSTDGLDVSGSKVRVMGNTFSNFSDKGVSIGEISNVLISDNVFYNNNMAIAVKDGSQSFIGKNKFENNKVDISMYIKKKIYNKPSLHTIPSNKLLNFKIVEGDVLYSNNLNNIFLREDVE